MSLGLYQVDIPIKYLGFFLEDDAELEHIKKVRLLPLFDLINFLVIFLATSYNRMHVSAQGLSEEYLCCPFAGVWCGAHADR